MITARTKLKSRYPALLIACLLAASCINSDYDLSDIDSTVGVGSDSLLLPSDNNTDTITLEDVFDLTYTNLVHHDSLGNYYIQMQDYSLRSMSALISRVRMSDYNVYTSETTFGLDDLIYDSHSHKVRGELSASFTGVVGTYDFTFEDIPSDIYDLSYVSTTATIRTTVSFSNNFRTCVNNISSVKLKLPSFLDIEKIKIGGDSIYANDDNTIELTDLSPKSSTVIYMHIRGIDLGKGADGDNILEFVRGSHIRVKANVVATGTVNISDVNTSKLKASDVYTVTGKAFIGLVTMNSATGHFGPVIEKDHLGSISLAALPPFLADDKVVLDLTRMSIDIDVQSQLPCDLKVNGDMVSYTHEGEVTARQPLPQFVLPSTEDGHVSIRNYHSQDTGDTLVVYDPSITEILQSVPDSLVLTNLRIEGDKTQECEVLLGWTYRVASRLSLSAPMSFGPKARIVYQHPYINWNHVLKDLSFVNDNEGKNNGHIVITANVDNSLPLYLTLSAYGLDTNGERISDDRLSVEVDKDAAASPDGRMVTTPVRIKIRPADNSVFKDLDGIMLDVSGSASSDDGTGIQTGIQLNSNKHKAVLRDIKVMIAGQMAVDLN